MLPRILLGFVFITMVLSLSFLFIFLLIPLPGLIWSFFTARLFAPIMIFRKTLRASAPHAGFVIKFIHFKNFLVMIFFNVSVNVVDGYISAKIIDGDNSLLDSTFKLESVLPKTVHAVVCSAVSDALAKSFNELLISKEERK